MTTECAIPFSDILEQIHSSTTILTPNRRLAATLNKQYHHYQIDQQNKYWPTPDILPLSSWIQRLLNDYTSQSFQRTPQILNAPQEQFIWESILVNARESTQLLQISETAELSRSALNLLKQWQVNLNDPIFHISEDYSAFHHWLMQFQHICQTGNWIDSASLPDILIEKINAGEIKLPQHIMLVGFTETNPQLKHLLSCCDKSGTKISYHELRQEQTECFRINLLDQEAEITAMARWAKSRITQQKEATVGCVIPSLETIRDRVLQIFSEVFATDKHHTVDTQSCSFNISAGKNLTQYPIISAAIQLLGLHKKIISTELFNALLASPFLGEAEIERIKRAHFDSLLRQANSNTINLLTALQKTDDKKQLSLANHCPHLAKRITQFLDQVEKYQGLLPYSEWAIVFSQLLSLLGWPGERSLNSEEYQVVESWLKLLSELTTLDQVATPVYYSQALQTLQRMAKKTVFQPKTPDAPIQVLGILEAAALPFDYLWVSGLDDLSWPPQPKPNPFIPKRLQRELHMPHATALRELNYCEQLTQQFKQSAKSVIFSHAEKNEELELQASPLIRDMPELSLETFHLEKYQSPSERIYLSKNMEFLADEIDPPLTANEKIAGGVTVIKHQALCPFKAFAEWRLHAHALETPLPGLRAKDRGNIIHKALEAIWNKLQRHTNLIEMEDKALSVLIRECINEAIDAFPHSRNTYQQYLSLEKERLHKLIWDWLQIEKDRPAFQVLMSEKSTQMTLNQLNLSFRIDRIDELSDGKKLIIDYKTGTNNEINNWFSDRPEEPQLPLYSLLDPENTVGITFAQLATGDNGFKGISQYALDIPGIKLISEVKKTSALSWTEQLTQWNTTLTKLSDDFSQGIAPVDPKEPIQTCVWCELKPLCRVNEEQN